MAKYCLGDHVLIDKDASHFQSDCDDNAIVIEASKTQDYYKYGLHVRGHGESWWYSEGDLSLVESNCEDMRSQWKADEDAEAKRKGDIDWIFANGQDVLNGAHGATMSTLGRCVGLNNLWGSRGEGITYYTNARAVLLHAKPFLEAGDKDGWLKYCKDRFNQGE